MDKEDKIQVMTAKEAWQVKKSRYNGWQTGHGKHKNKKAYDRKDKSWKKEEW